MHRARRPATLFLAATAAAAVSATVLTGVSAAAMTHPARASLPAATGGWNSAQEVPGTAALNKGGTAAVTSVSCASAGSCSAGGYYSVGGSQFQTFVTSETDGTWGAARQVPGTAALNKKLNAVVTSVSCASAGNCTAGGYYTDGDGGQQVFTAGETDGTWDTAKEVPGTATLNVGGSASINSVSCASAGNCTAGGYYTDVSGGAQAFVASESSGVWQTAEEVPGTASLNKQGDASITSVSCASAGNCSVGGSYMDASYKLQAFVASESSSAWQTAREVPGTATLNAGGSASIGSVSCASAGNCTAGGSYSDSSFHGQAFVVGESHGTWGTAKEVPGTATLNAGGSATVNSVSCASAGNCSAGGFYTGTSGGVQAFVTSESSGVWQTAEEVPGTASLNTAGGAYTTTVSCASAGNCNAGGTYTGSSGNETFVVSQVKGVWANAQETPGTAALNAGGNADIESMSCVGGSCSAGGFYTDTTDKVQAFVVRKT